MHYGRSKKHQSSLVDRTLNNWFELNHGSFWSRYRWVLIVYTCIPIIILICVFFAWLSVKNLLNSQFFMHLLVLYLITIVVSFVINYRFLIPLSRLILTDKRYQVFHEQWCTAYDKGFHMSFNDVAVTFKCADFMERSSNWTYIGFWQKVDGGIVLVRNIKPYLCYVIAIITEDHEHFRAFEKMCYKKLGNPDHKQRNNWILEHIEHSDKKPEMTELEPEKGVHLMHLFIMDSECIPGVIGYVILFFGVDDYP